MRELIIEQIMFYLPANPNVEYGRFEPVVKEIFKRKFTKVPRKFEFPLYNTHMELMSIEPFMSDIDLLALFELVIIQSYKQR